MRSLFIIAGYNFRDIISKRFFKVFTFLFTLFILMICVLPDLVVRFGILEKKKEYLFYIVDNENYIFDGHLDLNLYASNSSALLDGEYFFHLVDDGVNIQDIELELSKGIINGYLVVNNRNSIDIFTKDNIYPDLKFVLDRYIVSSRISNDDVDYGDVYINYGNNLSMTPESKFKSMIQSYTMPAILSLFIYIILVVYGQFLSVSVNIEKNSKITENFLTKSKPLNIILGKIIGVLLACTLQLVYFLILLFLIVGFLSKDFQIIKNAVELNLIFIAKYLIYFILGFILYGLVFMVIGNSVNRTEDLSIGFIPITFVISVGCALTFINIQFPHNNLIGAINFIPFFTPFSMISKTMTPLLDMGVILLMIICIVILVIINVSVLRFKGNYFREKGK